MKAVKVHEVGGPEVLQYVETEQPAPVAGQVRLRVAASAFNAADNGMRAGFLPIPVVLPHVPGYDVSGIIDAVGEGVEGVQGSGYSRRIGIRVPRISGVLWGWGLLIPPPERYNLCK
jgi:NADPH:quinone reductase-like Zn-dependent oxidoreductase